MNKIEHLLACLTDECAEITQAADKALRFGLDDQRPGGETDNRMDIEREINDLVGVIELLVENGVTIHQHRHYIDAKKEKVLKFMDYARNKGTLQG